MHARKQTRDNRPRELTRDPVTCQHLQYQSQILLADVVLRFEQASNIFLFPK